MEQILYGYCRVSSIDQKEDRRRDYTGGTCGRRNERLGGNLEVIFCPESAEESEVIRDFEAWGVKVYWEEETTGI